MTIFALSLLLLFLLNESWNKDIALNLVFSMFSPLFLLMLETYIDFSKLINLEGTYETWSYETDNFNDENDKDRHKYRTLKSKRNGIAFVKYEGANILSIKVKGDKESRIYKWEGSVELSEANMGTLSWRYTSPTDFKDFVGYKKMIVIKYKREPIKIYLFGEDKHIQGREVLIKVNSSLLPVK